MNTSFVAYMNKRGIACASDTDMTMYALSKQEPVALAVNSYSPIPWDTIINDYLDADGIALAVDGERLEAGHTQLPGDLRLSRSVRTCP